MSLLSDPASPLNPMMMESEQQLMLQEALVDSLILDSGSAAFWQIMAIAVLFYFLFMTEKN